MSKELVESKVVQSLFFHRWFKTDSTQRDFSKCNTAFYW